MDAQVHRPAMVPAIAGLSNSPMPCPAPLATTGDERLPGIWIPLKTSWTVLRASTLPPCAPILTPEKNLNPCNHRLFTENPLTW